jgi:hypothetical protein
MQVLGAGIALVTLLNIPIRLSLVASKNELKNKILTSPDGSWVTIASFRQLRL